MLDFLGWGKHAKRGLRSADAVLPPAERETVPTCAPIPPRSVADAEIRSDMHQRLLRRWRKARFLARTDIPPDSGLASILSGNAESLLCCSVKPAAGGGNEYRLEFGGEHLIALFDFRRVPVRVLDLVPEWLRETLLASYDLAVAERAPVYSVYDLRDLKGCPVQYERLLLPCGETDVRYVLTAVNVVSEKDDACLQGLMVQRNAAPVLRIFGTLAPAADFDN